MAKGKKQWGWVRTKPSQVPDALKREVSSKAENLVKNYLKPEHVKPPPKKPKFNYLVDLFIRWKGRFFYFIARYACPGPNSIAPFFEIGFARLEFVGDDRFDLAYFRPTGEWWPVHCALTLDEALDLVKSEGIFQP
ncbi:MAG: hypothetical protein ABID54_04640 [Pseudomonadota bacterium]